MRPPDWFQIAPVVPTDRSEEVRQLVHAKAFGTTVTACGLPAANMQREWDLPFDVRNPNACVDCARAIATYSAEAASARAAKRPARQAL